MANWAFTEYEISGKIENLKKIVNILERMESGELAPIDKSECMWEGNLLYHLGHKSYNKDIRGFITWVDLIENLDGKTGLLYLTAEEAWCITTLRQKLYDIFTDDEDFHIDVTSEEPGNDYYVSTKDIEEVRFFYDIKGKYDTVFLKNRDELEPFCLKTFNMTLQEVKEWIENSETDSIEIALYEKIL